VSTIIVNIELDHHWTVYTDPKTGSTHLQAYVEEGEKEWIHVLLGTPERGRWEGTKFHNRATVVIKNSEYEEAVSAVISVGDPRGGFCMQSSVNQTGHYLSVPTDQESLPHVDDMEKRGEGFYKLTHYPAKVDEEEAEEE
jgi:hypothetical protein